MGVDLWGCGGDFSLNWRGWRQVFEVAENYGWRPMGTLPPDDWHNTQTSSTTIEPPTIWKGGYFSNDGQVICEADAEQLHLALERALHEIASAASDGICLRKVNCDRSLLSAVSDLARRGSIAIY